MSERWASRLRAGIADLVVCALAVTLIASLSGGERLRCEWDVRGLRDEPTWTCERVSRVPGFRLFAIDDDRLASAEAVKGARVQRQPGRPGLRGYAAEVPRRDGTAFRFPLRQSEQAAAADLAAFQSFRRAPSDRFEVTSWPPPAMLLGLAGLSTLGLFAVSLFVAGRRR